MRYGLLAAVIAVAFAGCAQNPRARISQVEITLTAAEKAATNYVELPLCPTNKPLCSDAAVSADIKTADNAAYKAVQDWKANPTANNETLALDALAKLAALVPSLVPSPAKP